jgi:hypothetical protein
MSFWNKLDKLLTRVESKGFKIANNLHYYTVNIMILGCCYGIYTMFKDYNDFFLDARVK